MIYILMIWTIVGYAGTSSSTYTKYDWRPLGEFHREMINGIPSGRTPLEMCEDAARQLNIKVENYRCVRSK